ncbi:MAG: glycerol-3-phosphate 1-O-acyltransferase PlsY [Deltaproteobacteria bacterium]|nr:glycerol-3-phosphate 1-O-acyltransferase PlsY [Deltaproteobacteria bacterium]
MILCIGAYLAGSVNFSLVVSRMIDKGDLRRYGSGNPGTTNAFRALGFKWASLILILDLIRGLLVALLARGLFDNPWMYILVCLALVVGNVYPVFHDFRGGKGFATSLGLYLAIDPLATLIGGVIWIIIVLVLKMASVGTLAVATLLPILLILRGCQVGEIGLGLILLGVIVYTHRKNIHRLLRGYEHKLDKK